MKRTFNVEISFQFELDDEDYSASDLRDGWGYGRYALPPTALDVKNEIRTCISGEFAQDEAGLTHFPDNLKLKVTENDLPNVLVPALSGI